MSATADLLLRLKRMPRRAGTTGGVPVGGQTGLPGALHAWDLGNSVPYQAPLNTEGLRTLAYDKNLQMVCYAPTAIIGLKASDDGVEPKPRVTRR